MTLSDLPTPKTQPDRPDFREELTAGSDWSPGFFEDLGKIAPDTIAAVDELLTSVRKARTSKPPRRL
jgi:hypothetical protein